MGSGRRRLSRPHQLTPSGTVAQLISKVAYSLAAGEIREVALRLPLRRLNRLRYSRGFLIVDAIQGGSQVAKRGFYFSPKSGGTAKHF